MISLWLPVCQPAVGKPSGRSANFFAFSVVKKEDRKQYAVSKIPLLRGDLGVYKKKQKE
jgi:hypothetical protein